MALLKPLGGAQPSYEDAVTNEYTNERGAKHAAARAAMLERKRLRQAQQPRPMTAVETMQAADKLKGMATNAALKIGNAGRGY